jgi:hypothetical protein
MANHYWRRFWYDNPYSLALKLLMTLPVAFIGTGIGLILVISMIGAPIGFPIIIMSCWPTKQALMNAKGLWGGR